MVPAIRDSDVKQTFQQIDQCLMSCPKHIANTRGIDIISRNILARQIENTCCILGF